MKKFIRNFISYLIFLITVSAVVSIGILVYANVHDYKQPYLAIIVLLYILFAAFVFFMVDYIRRNVLTKRPLIDILDATKLISEGNFDIHLIPRHSYSNYDELDKIMININKMALKLKEESILKSDFISNFSHEIKTPISIILGYTNTLMKNKLDEKNKEIYLEKLNNATKNLSDLITNILKLNKIDNNEIELEETNLSMILENVIVGFDEVLSKKNLNLDIDLDDRVIINSNSSLIQVIFSNLISNAIKFSPDGAKIEIKLKKNNNMVSFMVKDYGIGMTKDTISHIFNKFYQGDTSHKEEGNGLGLAMVKSAIDKLKYKISIESEEKKGSTFIVDMK